MIEKTFYKQLKLEQEGIPFKFFEKIVNDLNESLFRTNNIFVRPKYFVDKLDFTETQSYICTYFSDSRRRQLIIDLYYDPQKVLKHLGVFHPLWYLSESSIADSIYKKLLHSRINDDYYISLDELRKFALDLYQHMTYVDKLYTVNKYNLTNRFRLTYEYSELYNVYYWKFNFPVFSELNCFITKASCSRYKGTALYPELSYNSYSDDEIYYISDDLMCYIANQNVWFDFISFKNFMKDVKELVDFVNNIDNLVNDTSARIPYILRTIVRTSSKIYVYRDDSKVVYVLNQKARKYAVQRISYNQFTKMILNHTI